MGSVNPETGGPIEGLLRTSEIMAKMGCTNEVLCLDSPSDPWIADFPLPVHALGPGIGKYRYIPAFHRWLRARARDYDGVILHGLWNYSSLGAWRALAETDTPYAIFVHGMMDPWHRQFSPLKHFAKQLFWLALEGRVLADAYAVLFTTKEEQDAAHNMFWGHSYRGRVVAYGTADVPDGGPAQIAKFRTVVPALGDRPYLLFLSRIHPKKGCDILLDGFQAVATKNAGLDLVVAGPDQVGWKQELIGRARNLGISDRVHWPGMLAGDMKWGALRGAEAFILPSHQENFGIAVTEALLCGTPVLISNKVNIWKDVEEAQCGIVSTDTAQGVTEMLSRFMALDADGRQRMRLAARETFLRRFDARTAARDLVNLVEEMRHAGRG